VQVSKHSIEEAEH